jgi:diacylglycerol O-acyltransferase / wax synthase
VQTGSRPLEAEDLAILSLENDTIAGHTCKVVVLDQPGIRRDTLFVRVADHLHRAPLLTYRLDSPTNPRRWVPDPQFDLQDHVVQHPGAPVERGRLLGVVAGLFEQHLDRARPLWSMTLVDLDDQGTAIVWKVHHAMADGTTLARWAALLLWDHHPAQAAGPGQLAHDHQADDVRRRAHLSAFLRREFTRQHGASPFDGAVGTTRAMGLATTSLSGLRAAAHSLDGATVNDAVLAVVSGALRRWIEEHHGPLVNVRARVPVSLHHEGDDPGNHDSFFTLELPLDEPDAVARLCSIHQQTSERKSANDARELESLYRELATVSPRLQQFAARLQASPRRFALSVSNVPGPRAEVSVLSSVVRNLVSFAEIGEHHALRVAAMSHADRLSFGFCADPALVPDVQAMATAAEVEADLLVAAAGKGDRPPGREA